MKHLVVLLLVVTGVWLGVSYYVGGEVKAVYGQLAAQFNLTTPLAVRPGNYHRGWLQSWTSTRIRFPGTVAPARLAGTDLELRHRIAHGPLPVVAWWRHGGFPAPAQTVIQSQVEERSTVLTAMGILGEAVTDLQARTWVELGGLVRIALELPRDLLVERDEQTLRIALFHGDAMLRPTGEPIRIALSLSELRWCRQGAASDCLRLSARLTGDADNDGPDLRWSAQGDLAVDETWLVDRLRQGFLARRQTRGEPPDEAALSLASGQARQQIALLVGAGILQRQGNRLHLDFHWNAGSLRLNGEARPWQQVLPVLSVVGAQLMGEV